MAEMESGRVRSWVWAVVAVVAALGAFFYLRGGRNTVPVRTAQVERHAITSSVSTNGKVEPGVDFQAHAPMPGVVEKIFVDLNQHVVQGQELVAMDDSDARKNVAAAEANLQSQSLTLQNMLSGGSQDEMLASRTDLTSAEAQAQQAEATVRSLEMLQGKGAASANEVAQARQRQTDAQAKVAQLRARKTGRYSSSDVAAQRAQVQQARVALAAAQSGMAAIDIRAPFAGTVYAIPVARYDFVQAGEALLDVADLNKLEIMAYFDEPEIGKLSVGQPVKIVWEAKPNQAWHGRILEAPTTIITYGTRNVGECRITVDDNHGDLLPNTNVTVTVTTSRSDNVLSLPREALHTDGANNYVFKIVDGRLKKAAIKVGQAINTTRFEIAGGLDENDVVALGSLNESELVDGLHVKAQNQK